MVSVWTQVLKDLGLASGSETKASRQLAFQCDKKFSTTALSQQLPGRLLEHAMPGAAAHTSPYVVSQGEAIHSFARQKIP